MKNNWEQVKRVIKPGEANTTFVRFNLGHTGRNFSVQCDRGFGVQEEDMTSPCIFARGKPRYFKTEQERDRYLERERDYWNGVNRD